MTLHEIHSDPLRHYPHVIHTLAYHAAMKIVKRGIAARGEKLVEWSAKDLRALAEAYVDANRAELLAKTIEAIRTTPAFLSLAEKEARRRGRMWPLEAKSARPGQDGAFFRNRFSTILSYSPRRLSVERGIGGWARWQGLAHYLLGQRNHQDTNCWAFDNFYSTETFRTLVSFG